MALKPCRECGKEVSDLAKVCPHCGVELPVTPVNNSGNGCVFATLGVVVAAIAMGYCMTSTDSPSTKSSLDDPKTTRSGFAVCTTLESMKRVVELARDRRAYLLYIANPASGCALLKPGLTVTIEDYGMGGYVKIRQPGEPTSMWVAKEAVGVTR